MHSKVTSPPDKYKHSGLESRIMPRIRNTLPHVISKQCGEGRFCMVITSNTLPRGISKPCGARHRLPQICFFHGCSANPNDVARVINAQTVQGFLGGRICNCRSSPHNEFCSAEHSDNVARKIDLPELQISRLLERSKRCGVVLREVGSIECIWGHVRFKLLGDASRCVGSMCGSCQHGEYKRS
jgi:hypothetical protein